MPLYHLSKLKDMISKNSTYINSNHINLKVVYWIKNFNAKFSSGLCYK